MSFLDKITQGLQKTRDSLFGRVASVFQPGRKLEESDYAALEAALLRADVGPATTDRILTGVKQRLSDTAYTGAPADAMRDAIQVILGNGGRAVAPGTRGKETVPSATARPHVTLVVGVNGTGKTTTIAKLANRYKQGGESVLLVACDTFRAAAADQLEIWAERAGVEMVKQKPGADPAAVAFDGMARAKSRNVERVIVDTAGRLHVKSNLMAELEKIRRVIGKALPGAPHETLLVLDATVGQNGLAQAREFDRALKLSGVALTKLDGTAKGGIVLAVADSLQMPIRWIGVGEGLDDLIPFDPAEFAAGLIRVEG
ncbi:MAG TPA: signal recognition particle-docking protein FtsY [Candidatus Dormibacteraeota bacterium]|nr:signal recognition particle-docking protein FtsY [Candidatus Dormibacteraeota bacterium]